MTAANYSPSRRVGVEVLETMIMRQGVGKGPKGCHPSPAHSPVLHQLVHLRTMLLVESAELTNNSELLALPWAQKPGRCNNDAVKSERKHAT